MKWLKWPWLTVVIATIAIFVIVIIGRFTIGWERIVFHIGSFAIGLESARLARWIIDKITDKNKHD